MTLIYVAPPRILPARSIPRLPPRPSGRRALDELENARYRRERRRADEDIALCAALGAGPGGSFGSLGAFWAAAPFNPYRISGVALDLNPSDPSGVTTTAATLSDESNFSAWTNGGGFAVTSDDDGDADLLTSTGETDAYVMQNLGNMAFGASGITPCTYSVQIKNDSGEWLLVQTTSSSPGNNRTWIDLDTWEVGTSGANHEDVTVSEPDQDGYRTISITVGASAGGLQFWLRLVANNGSTTQVEAGQEIWAKNASVSQVRVSGLVNLISDTAVAQATANNQPGWEEDGINGKSAIRSYVPASATHFLATTEEDVLDLVDGDDTPHTLFFVVDPQGDASSEHVIAAWLGSDSAAYVISTAATTGAITITKRGDADDSAVTFTSSYTLADLADGVVLVIRNNGETVDVRVNDGALDSGSLDAGEFTPTSFRLLASSSAGSNLSMGRVLGYGRTLTDGEVTYLVRGLARAYGLSL